MLENVKVDDLVLIQNGYLGQVVEAPTETNSVRIEARWTGNGWIPLWVNLDGTVKGFPIHYVKKVLEV